jgi:hypothetical protein
MEQMIIERIFLMTVHLVVFCDLVPTWRTIHFFKRKLKTTLRSKVQVFGSALVCLFLTIKELSVQALDDEFVTVRGSDAIAYSMLTKHLH